MLWGIGGNIIQPLFMGGALRANLKSKKIAYEKMLKNYEKVNLTSMQEVNDSLVSANMDREKLAKTLSERMDETSALIIGDFDRVSNIDKLLESYGFVQNSKITNLFEKITKKEV